MRFDKTRSGHLAATSALWFVAIAAISFASGCSPKVLPISTKLPILGELTDSLAIVPASKTLAVGNGVAFSATGGQAPYAYSVVSSGGGSIHPATGVYTAPEVPGTYTIRVTDSEFITKDATVTVNPEVSITPATITMTAKSGYTYPFAPAGGVPPYTYDVVSGPGTLDSNGIYAAPDTNGSSQLRVRDSLGNSALASVSNLTIRTNGVVNAMVSDATSLYIGGSFSAVNPYSTPRLMALDLTTGNPNLGFDLQAGFNGKVSAVAVSGGSIYAVGSFTTYRGQPAERVAKLDLATGNLDTSFTQATGASGDVIALAISGSSLYFGGYFETYRGLPAQNLAKVDLTTGNLDTVFTQATGANATVYCLVVSGTSLYFGGLVTSYRGQPAPRLVKVDLTTGDLDTTFTQGLGPNTIVFSLAVSGPSLYVGGSFTTYRAQPALRLAKVDLATGDLDTTFTQAVGPGNVVYSLAASGSSLYVGGIFTTYRGVAAHGLAKVDLATGDLDTTFTQATGANAGVYALTIFDSKLYVGGVFNTYRGQNAERLAKVDLTTGNMDATFTQTTGANGGVYAFCISGSLVYVGGVFTTYRGTPALYVAKQELATGALDTTFTRTTGFNAPVKALLLSGSSLYVGGSFASYRGQAAENLAKLDVITGDLDTGFTQAPGMDDQVSALAASGSSLYVGGDFNSYRGQPARHLAKLDLATGNLDTTFTQATGPGNSVYSLVVSGSSLYLGGMFSTYRGANAQRLAKVDLTTGNLDTTFTQATGMNSIVFSVTASDSSLYVGGWFSTYRGQPAPYLAKVDLTTGNLDTTFTQVTGLDAGPLVLLVSGSSLYLGGAFSTYRGDPALFLAKMDLTTGNLDTAFTQATGTSGLVNTLNLSGSALHVGGGFSAYREQTAYHLVTVDPVSGDDLD